MAISVPGEIQEYLEEFGLGEREVVLYLTLLKTGPNTILNLSRETGIKRSTTHNNVEELIKRGLISQTHHGDRRLVIAEEPEKLNFLMDQQKWKVNRLEDGLSSTIQRIEQMIPAEANSTKTEVRFFEGEGVQSIYKQALASNEIRAFVTSDIDKIFPENANIFAEELEKNKNLRIWEILDSEIESHAEYISNMASSRYKFKYIKEKLLVPDYLIFSGKVAVVDKNQSNNTIGIVISSDNFYKSTLQIFQLIWNILPEARMR